MVQRPGVPTRRGVVVCVLAIGLALGVGGCSTLAKAQSAAIVKGSPIYTADLATTTDQFNAYQVKAAQVQAGGQVTPISQREMLGFLVRARFLVPYIQRTGAWKPDVGYAQVLALIPGATTTTQDFLLTAYSESNKFIPAAAEAAITAEMKKADIEVDPRYGSYSVTPNSNGSSFSAAVPDWIKPQSQPNAPDPATGQ